MTNSLLYRNVTANFRTMGELFLHVIGKIGIAFSYLLFLHF